MSSQADGGRGRGRVEPWCGVDGARTSCIARGGAAAGFGGAGGVVGGGSGEGHPAAGSLLADLLCWRPVRAGGWGAGPLVQKKIARLDVRFAPVIFSPFPSSHTVTFD